MWWKADPTFYASPKLAGQAPPESLAYVAAIGANGGDQADALLVVDVDPASERYGKIVGGVDMPNAGDELHHFGWNACRSALWLAWGGEGLDTSYRGSLAAQDVATPT